MRKALFHTLGCKLNQAETVQVSELWLSEGIAEPIDKNLDKPEIVFVNSCCVTEKAAAKSRHAIARLARLYPEADIVAAGCLAQADPDNIAAITGVDYVIGTQARFSTEWLKADTNIPFVDISYSQRAPESAILHHSLNRSRPFLKIQDGCDHNCSYCIIPLLRGTSRSVERCDVLSEAKQLVSQGAFEIVLTGVRIGSWGQDLEEKNTLPDLLRSLTEISGLHRIRLGSIEPWELSEELVDFAVSNEKICPHLHVSLQHTHPLVLERMGRPKVSGTLRLLEEVKRINPDFAIGTDIIVGFPGESEEEFNRLHSDLVLLPLSYIHTFGFSRRPGTVAATLPQQLPTKLIKKRVAAVIKISNLKKYNFARSQVGKDREVIPDKTRSGRSWTQGITDNYLRLKITSNSITSHHPIIVKVDINSTEEVIGVTNGSRIIS